MTYALMARVELLDAEVRRLTNERDTLRANEDKLRSIVESYERDLRRVRIERDVARWFAKAWSKVARRHRARANAAEEHARHSVPPLEAIGWDPMPFVQGGADGA